MGKLSPTFLFLAVVIWGAQIFNFPIIFEPRTNNRNLSGVATASTVTTLSDTRTQRYPYVVKAFDLTRKAKLGTAVRGGSMTTAMEQQGVPRDGVLGRIRDAVFPLYGFQEISKFLSLGALQFFVILVLTLTRDLKDTLVITSCGAEAISFLKVYGVLPAATMFMLYYSKISTLLSKRALFYSTAMPFFVFFACFKLFVYPMRDFLHPSASTSASDLPEWTRYLRSLYSNWTFALFYVISELYSSVSIGVLFWQFANDIVPVEQAKRFYPMFGQLSSLAPVLGGLCVMRYTGRASNGNEAVSEGLVGFVMTLVTVAGVAIFTLYEVSTALSVAETKQLEAEGETPLFLKPAVKPKKPKLGLAESFRVLAKSKYLGYLATLVLGYGLCINMTEVMWKSMVKNQYPDQGGYASYMAKVSSISGMSTFVIIFLGSNLVKHLGWRAGALATPVTMAALAVPLFAVILATKGDMMGSELEFAVLVGTAQSILSKATKIALFDPTTQMAYIPLDEESKVKGKAAIDGLGSRLGKSGASFLQQWLIVLFGSILNAAPVVAAIFYSALGAWTFGVVRLSDMFEAKTKENQDLMRSPYVKQTHRKGESSRDFEKDLMGALRSRKAIR